MNEMARNIGRLEGRLQAVETKVAEMERSLDARLVGIEGKLDGLTEAFNLGRGAAITLVKIGGLVALGLGAAAWLFDHLPAWAR